MILGFQGLNLTVEAKLRPYWAPYFDHGTFRIAFLFANFLFFFFVFFSFFCSDWFVSPLLVLGLSWCGGGFFDKLVGRRLGLVDLVLMEIDRAPRLVPSPHYDRWKIRILPELVRLRRWWPQRFQRRWRR